MDLSNNIFQCVAISNFLESRSKTKTTDKKWLRHNEDHTTEGDTFIMAERTKEYQSLAISTTVEVA